MEYISILGNYDPDYLSTGFGANGYFDTWNLSTAELGTDRLDRLKIQRSSLVDSSAHPSGYKTYQLIFRPPFGIFNCLKPLGTGHEIKILFDRAPSEAALIAEVKDTENPLKGKSLEIRNPYIKATYATSQYLRDAINNDTSQEYIYDELNVFQKNIPIGETLIRLPNIIGGQLPKFIFAGILPSLALNPDQHTCLTEFPQCGVEEFSFTFNGQVTNGFPLHAPHGSPIEVYDNFLTVTSRKYNNKCSGAIEPYDFKMMHNIYAYKFEENDDSGWIGVNLKLKKAFESNHVLGKCIISSFEN